MSAVNPTVTVSAPIGQAIGTQTAWKARIAIASGNGSITRVIVMAEFPNFDETVYRNGSFTAAYNGASSYVNNGNGTIDLAIIRNGGWPASPNIYVHANTDQGGMTQ